MAEFVRDLAMTLDPVALFRHTLAASPDPWQVDVLRSDARQLIINASRQVGKTQTLAVKVAHLALYRSPSRIVIIGPTLWQSLLSFKEVAQTMIRAGRPVEYDRETRTVIELANGSTIWALPGSEKTVRGLAGLDLIVVDEASRITDDLIDAIRPMLAVRQGAMILASTPWTRAGVFYRTWTAGEEWEKYEIPATRCPRLTPAFLDRERRELGQRGYAREYLCQFASLEGGVFDVEHLERLINPSIEPLFPDLVDDEDHPDRNDHHVVVPLDITI